MSDIWEPLRYTDRLRIWEIFAIDLVHSGKIIHVGEEDIDLHRLGET
jgi:hypothetical protein